MFKRVFESTEPIKLLPEDSGRCLKIVNGEPIEVNPTDDENGLVVELHSWDDNMKHVDLRGLEGKRVRITVEVI